MILGTVVWGSLLACAQEPKAPPPPLKIGITTTDSYRFDADLEGVGQVAVSQVKLTVDASYTAGMMDYLKFNAGFDFYRYDFSSDAELLPGVTDLFEDMFVMRAEGSWIHVFDMQWSGLAAVNVYSQYEEGASPADGVSLGLGIGPMMRLSADLTIGVALRIQTRIEESPYVFPLPIIDWKITPELTLQNESRVGTGYSLTYSLDPAGGKKLEARGYYAMRRFRLDEGSVPDKGVVQDDRFALDAGFRMQLAGGTFSWGVHAGLDLWQQYTVESRDGDNLEEVSTDPSPFMALTLSLSF